MKIVAAAAVALFSILPGLPAQDAPIDQKKEEIKNKLNNQRISLDFKDVTLDDAINFIREFTNINIVVDSEVHTKYSDEQLRITIKVKDLILKSAMKLMLANRDLSVTYKEGVLLIVPKERVEQNVGLQVYDVRDLLFKIQDFPGPKVELTSPTGGGGGTPLTGATFTLEEPKSIITEDFIAEMVKANTGEGAWDSNPNASIALANGLLIVTQTAKVHREIASLLSRLRQFK